MSSDWKALKDRGVYVDGMDEPDPVYRWVGTYVTGVQDPIYPWHLDDVMTIRRMIGNDFIPITRRMVYRGPSGGEQYFVHLGIGIKVENYAPEAQLQGIVMPTWAPWPRPNRVGFWLEPAAKGEYGLPGPTVAWGDWVVQMAREARQTSAKERIQKAKLAREREAQTGALKQAEEEAAYRQREEARYQKRLIGSMSSSELVEFKDVLTGKRSAEIRDPKPFVHVQG